MSFEAIKSVIPEYAKDIKLNLSSLQNDETLSTQQLWGTFVAAAVNTGDAGIIEAAEAEAAAKGLSQQTIEAARAAAIIMAMNNVYYKSIGMMGEAYRTIPAKLRMNVIANPGVPKADFELWSLAVSAMNGCQFCLVAHEKALRDLGVTVEQIQTSLRVAAVVQALAAVSSLPQTQAKLAQAA